MKQYQKMIIQGKNKEGKMSKEPFSSKMFKFIFKKPLERILRQSFSVREDENSLLVGVRRSDESRRDRLAYDREQVLEDCLEAWRLNPLARRIVELTSQYVAGGGLLVKCRHAATNRFVDAFWQNRLNRMEVRVIEMCDELTRTGNLFVLISTDAAGMSYLRIVPANNIEAIQSAENDIEQALAFTAKAEDINGEGLVYPAYDENTDALDENGRFSPRMLHYAINRPAGAQWGESDLAPLLRWLSRYSAWLEDRVRLNRFRNAFLYVVKAKFINEAARRARQIELAANPPSPGSILVTDDSEEWSVISPRLEALDASTDGLAVKKMIAAGAGVPLHFLAEPESATRTTAEAAGGPTYRRFEQRQRFFQWMLVDILKVVTARRRMVDARVDPEAALAVYGADISARDNVALSMAGINVASLFEKLYDMGMVDAAEMLRVIYRFIGESGDLDELLQRGTGIDQRKAVNGEAGKAIQPAAVKIDPETGELKPAAGIATG